MDEMLDIRELVRRTGLTSRTLRYYEARGLVAPLRTQKGRRLYGPPALERINQIVALKRAGLTLARIAALIARHPPDLARLVDAQLAALAVRQNEIAEAMKLLIRVGGRIERGESVDVATFCDLIRQGDGAAEAEAWKREVVRGLIGEDQLKPGVERMWAVLSRIDPEAHKRECTDLFGRIEAALPLNLDSPMARAFHDEWRALTAPLMAFGEGTVASNCPHVEFDEAMQRIDDWNRAAKAPCAAAVWQFLFTAARAHGRERKRRQR